MTSSNILVTSLNLLPKCVLNYMYTPFTKITWRPDFPGAAREAP